MDDSALDLEKEISFLKQANKGIRKSLEEINQLQTLLKTLSSSKSLENVFDAFLTISSFYFSFKGLIYYELDLSDLSFRTQQSRLTSDSQLKNAFEITESILSWVMSEKQISIVPRNTSNESTDSLLLVPMVTSSRMLGVLAILTDTSLEESLTQQATDILGIAAGQASIAIENVKLYVDLKKQHDESIRIKNYTHSILESLLNGIIAFDMKKNITHINGNAAVMLGINQLETVDRHYREVLRDNMINIIDLLFNKTLEDGFVLDYKVDIELSGGVVIPYAISTSPLRNASQDLIGITFITRDMTASRELDRLRKLDKLKNDFVSTVSHELRSPLATIRAYIDTLINRVDADDVDARDMFLKTIEDEAGRLTTLVENMLDIASIESGKINLELSLIKIDEIVHSVSKLCQMQTSIHEIKMNIQNDLPKLNIDKDRMTQVLHNLVNNAIKYSPDGCDILIKVYENLSAINIDVIDYGLGIKKDDLNHLFEKFFRIDSQKTSDIGGTGLGLAIVQKLVELHGGKVEVESIYGEGSTFRIILPY